MSRWLAKRLMKVPKVEPMTHLLSVYGVAGLTAYFGLLRIADPKPGETVVVSAAAGSVGTIVGQIAKIKGCRVVGIAGGRQKCDWLVKDLGFDAAVDYKAGPVFKALKEAAPKGIDVYFDNVGGDILEACLFQMNTGGRVSCCGAISAYDGAAPPAGPRGVPGLIVVKRLTLKGFIVTDFFAERDKAIADLQSWVAAGQAQNRGRRDRRFGEHPARTHRPARWREPRQAHGQGGLSRSRLARTLSYWRVACHLASVLPALLVPSMVLPFTEPVYCVSPAVKAI